MFIFLAAVSALISAAVEIRFFTKNKSFQNGLLLTLKNLVLVEFLSLAAVKYILKYPHFVSTEGSSAKEFIIFFIVSSPRRRKCGSARSCGSTTAIRLPLMKASASKK